MDAAVIRRGVGGLAVLALATGCARPVPLPGPLGAEPADPPVCAETRGQRVLELVNAVRREHGLRALTPDLRLVRAAIGHARDQAARNEAEIGHIGSDGSAPGERVAAAGYEWAMVGENVAGGTPGPDGVVAAWMESPPHRAMILAPQPIHAGLGYVHSPHGPLRHYWTLKIAAPADPEAAGESAPCHP